MKVPVCLWAATLCLLLCIPSAGGPSPGEADIAPPCNRRFLAGQIAGYCTTSGTPSPFCCHYLEMIFNRTRSMSCAKQVLNQPDLKGFLYTEELLLKQYVSCSIDAAINSRDSPGYLASDGWATCPRPSPCPQPSPCPTPPPCPQCPELRELSLQQGSLKPPSAPEGNWLANWFGLFFQDWKNAAAQATLFVLALIGLTQVIKKLWEEMNHFNERSSGGRGTGAWAALFSPRIPRSSTSFALPPELELPPLR